jgi:putative endonuclease
MRGKRAWGEAGEMLAAKLLRSHGYKIIAKNFRSKFGEIDLIAYDPKNTLVFVEVKARWGKKFGSPEDAVGPRKLAKIVKTAQYYCLKNNISSVPQRIDVVAIQIEKGVVKNSKIIKAL